MVKKHPKKKQRNGTQADEAVDQPLGSVSAPLHEHDAKDEEEKRLEAMLFGTNFIFQDTNASKQPKGLDDDEFKKNSGELDNLEDSDVSTLTTLNDEKPFLTIAVIFL